MTADEQSESIHSAVDRLWQERGLPEALLAEARRLAISNELLARMLAWNAPVERMELEVEWARQLIDGNIRFRQLTYADAEAFRELWLNAPEEIGEWDVTIERGANAFAQFELQERPVLNGLFDGPTMVACVSFSLRTTIVDGERLTVRFGQAMRVHKDHRRHGYANWVRSLPWAIGLNMLTQVQYDFIRSRNMLMERWNRGFMPAVESVPKREGDVPGVPATVLQYRATRASGGDSVRPARVDDVPACAALINATHAGRDLFRPYTEDSLVDRLDPGFRPPVGPAPPQRPYCIDDFYVVERRGAIVANAGLWDRGRDAKERWRHRETGEERALTAMSMLDIGYADGHADALAALVDHFCGMADARGRDYVVAPFETMPDVAGLLAAREPVPETRYLQWRTDTPSLKVPAYLDLVYW